jgi:hypothetical protein
MLSDMQNETGETLFCREDNPAAAKNEEQGV